MAKDDYPVLVYQVLAYLYVQLKAGEPVDKKLLEHDGPYLNINETYWRYIISNLVSDGFIEGLTLTKVYGGVIISDLDKAQITPKGIEYLSENSFIQKAKKMLKDAKSIVPFV